MKRPDDIDPVNLAQFENARKRTLEQHLDLPFIRTYRPVLDDGPGRALPCLLTNHPVNEDDRSSCPRTGRHRRSAPSLAAVQRPRLAKTSSSDISAEQPTGRGRSDVRSASDALTPQQNQQPLELLIVTVALPEVHESTDNLKIAILIVPVAVDPVNGGP